MKKCIPILLLAFFLMHDAAQALTTGMTGEAQSFSNMEPSLAVTAVIVTEGFYPAGDSASAQGDTVGFVYYFAGNFAPEKSLLANGQQLTITGYTVLYSLIGPLYGGDGRTKFLLPNLAGTATLATGAGTGLTPASLGVSKGSAAVTLKLVQLPTHDHALPGGNVTQQTGGDQPFSTVQPSLPMTRVIATSGYFPGRNGNSGYAAFVGQIATYAGLHVPGGWHAADGSLLSTTDYPDLFSIIGTTYGGDGNTTFALPDLRGRVSVGASDAHPLGTAFGQESTTLTTAQLPAHDHTLSGGGKTGATGDGQPVDMTQPSLAVNYIIAINGLYPWPGGNEFDTYVPLIGQISEFAGNYAPSGWAFADGSLLSITAYRDLYNVIGTTYGGDGTSTFALPDLRGRTLIGTSTDSPVGTQTGAEQATLTVANLPAHAHEYTAVAVKTPAVMLLLGDDAGN